MLGHTTLFVKHLPSELSVADREELLKLVGAVKVNIMPDNGKMKYTAFATFQTHEDAKYALSLLHQRKIFDHHLVVEFAKEQHQNFVPHESDYVPFQNVSVKESASKSSEKEVLRLDMEDFSRKLHGIAPALGLDYLPSQLLKYKYPPPTPTIIQNIAHALASVPKFYTQVLHLMNKMNLPAPFGPLTPAPPLAPDLPAKTENTSEIMDRDSFEVENMAVTSSEESEYESESEGGDHKIPEKVLPQKRPMQKPKHKRKKQKLANLMPMPNASTGRQITEPSEVFEVQTISQKKINVKKIDHLTSAVGPTPVIEPCGSFGAIEAPKPVTGNEGNQKEPGEDEWDDSQFITLEALRKKKISSREMKTMSVFRNFSPGEPSVRLYIKNLARQVEEKDLRYIFGRFIDRNSEQDRNMFDIKLMKEGRMKGQAFVTLANEKQATEAIKETNGFVLHTKPLVVQFARSAKPKEEGKKEKKS
ncbi:RNA-binding region-containing protein 3-like [Stegodyphus dumicola]|uniref:RNA-binding region-containing protein 3-like n=1 Tax=Stegodyphus dumicola TaxID=202533 RepID=UPI0015AB9A97|nr:RNA-binding region-containing protein 3-like [Stegodyphus dumicola]XP_035215770.1 RNA-binding region-containing protein 3-like [Stegodyphus dumicola]XP_035215771.1 RNA-binding region-containing protein 3-like [Stegodyphus dumicola]